MKNKNLYIVTGSSSGIGKALVEELVKNSSNKVIGIARNNDFIADNYSFQVLDLSKIEQVKAFNFPDFKEYTSIHLINNAGSLGEINTHDKIGLDHIEDTITINYTSCMILATKFIQAYQNIDIIKTIINISSGAATGAYASWANYCASKAAIEMFSRCINIEQEVMEFPIFSFSIAPGVVDTNMQAYIRSTDIENFAMKPKFEELYTEQKLYSPLSVAQELIQVTLNPQDYKEKVFRVQI